MHKITVEFPSLWINEQEGGDRNYKFFYHFLIELCNLGIPVNLLRHEFGDEAVQRNIEPGEFVFAYHHHNDAHINNVWTIKESPIFDLYSIDNFGYSRWSSLVCNDYSKEIANMDVDKCLSIIKHYAQKLNEGNSKYKQADTTFNIDKPYIALFLQCANDASSDNPWFTTDELVLNVCELCASNNIQLVIKPHPKDTSCLIPALMNYVRNKYGAVITDASIITIAKHARAVVALNSGASFEAFLCSDVPVYNIAPSEWSPVVNMTHDLSDILDFRRNDTQYTIQYCGFLLSKFWVNVNDRKAIADKIKYALSSYKDINDVDFQRVLQTKVRSIHGTVGQMERVLHSFNQELGTLEKLLDSKKA